MTNETPAVLYAVDESIATLTLNRPEKRNALNKAIIDQLKTSLRKANDDTAIKAIIITGAGADFCSGADLSALQNISTASVEENAADARTLLELFVLIREVRVPVIAAVRGRALAGGCGLATACDLVLASATARFGYPEVKIGFVPAMVAAILRRNVSEKRAFELLTRGLEIDARTARKFGFVTKFLQMRILMLRLAPTPLNLRRLAAQPWDSRRHFCIKLTAWPSDRLSRRAWTQT